MIIFKKDSWKMIRMEEIKKIYEYHYNYQYI